MAKWAAIGLRPHTGWSVAVAVGGELARPHVIDRRRLELGDPSLPAPAYHAARKLAPDAAKALVQRVEASARAAAERALHDLRTELRESGYRLIGGSVVSSRHALPALESILASHALVHAAEGRMYAEALVRACERVGLPVALIPPRELYERATAALGVADETLRKVVAELGRELGPPWRADQKDAAAAAWLALAAGSDARRG